MPSSAMTRYDSSWTSVLFFLNSVAVMLAGIRLTARVVPKLAKIEEFQLRLRNNLAVGPR